MNGNKKKEKKKKQEIEGKKRGGVHQTCRFFDILKSDGLLELLK